jgi:hypothetical protein
MEDNTKDQKMSKWGTKGGRFTLISWIANFIIAGYFSVTMSIGFLKIFLLLMIALIWSYTAKIGEKIYKLTTPQQKYITESRLHHILSEWALTLVISVGGYYLIVMFFTGQL